MDSTILYMKNGQPLFPYLVNSTKYVGPPPYECLYGNKLTTQNGVSILWAGSFENMGLPADGGNIDYEFSNGYIIRFEGSLNQFNQEQIRQLVIYPDGTEVGRFTLTISGGYTIWGVEICEIQPEVYQFYPHRFSLDFLDIDQTGGIHLYPRTNKPVTITTFKADGILPNSDKPEGGPPTGEAPYNEILDVLWDWSVSPRVPVQKWVDLYNDFISTVERNDPNNAGGITHIGGGGGNFDDSSDPIDFPTLPTLDSLNTGFVTVYSPTVSELHNLSTYMYSDDFVDSIVKMFSSPIESVISFGCLPFDVPSYIDDDVKIGGISTGISMHKVVNQYQVIDCGTLNVSEYWGSCLDYSPHTKVNLYCPFAGIQQISTDDIMGKTITLKYYVDVLSGSFVAMLKCNESVMYSWGGSMFIPMPITQQNWGQLWMSLTKMAVEGATAVATGGITSATAMGSAMSTASNVMNSKPTISKGGGIGSTSGFLSVRKPYLIIERPNQALAEGYMEFRGYPSNINYRLGTLKGYTEVESIHLENIPATTSELSEIETLLMGGVIL